MAKHRTPNVRQIAWILLFEQRWNRADVGHALHDPQAFVIAEEEGLVLTDRATQTAPKLVLTVLWLSTGSGEIIPRVEHVISHKLVHGAMELVGTRFSNQIYDGARRFPDFGRI